MPGNRHRWRDHPTTKMAQPRQRKSSTNNNLFSFTQKTRPFRAHTRARVTYTPTTTCFSYFSLSLYRRLCFSEVSEMPKVLAAVGCGTDERSDRDRVNLDRSGQVRPPRRTCSNWSCPLPPSWRTSSPPTSCCRRCHCPASSS